jgi:hypothetical protein
MPKIDYIIENFPKKVYNTEIDSNLYKLLSSFGNELDNFLTELQNVRTSRSIETATGNDLDKIASFLNMKRYNENDETFRGRIKSRVRSFTGGGVTKAIKEVINFFLGVEPTIIEHYKPDEGFDTFDNGVLNGLNVSANTGLYVKVNSGIWYSNGNKIINSNSNYSVGPLTINTTNYIVARTNGNYGTQTSSTLSSGEILLATVVTGASSITSITDKRFILNPEEHNITNNSTITIQIPYDFTGSKISIEDTKQIIRETKAAGVAFLLNIVGAYSEKLTLTDRYDFSFMVGHSGIGSSNFFGGNS